MFVVGNLAKDLFSEKGYLIRISENLKTISWQS
jgi:hypothetical protein